MPVACETRVPARPRTSTRVGSTNDGATGKWIAAPSSCSPPSIRPWRWRASVCGTWNPCAARSFWGRRSAVPWPDSGTTAPPGTVAAALRSSGTARCTHRLSVVHRIGLSRTEPGAVDRVHFVQSRIDRRVRSDPRGQGRRRHRRRLRHHVPGLVRRFQRHAQRLPRRLQTVRSPSRRPRPRRRQRGADRGGRRFRGRTRRTGPGRDPRLRDRIRRPQHDRAGSDRVGAGHLHAAGRRHGRRGAVGSGSDLRSRNGHGAQDRVEARALRKVFGPRAGDIPCASIKSMLGHTLGAAGAMNAAAAIATRQGGYIPPTIHFEEPDPCDPVACSAAVRPGAPRHVLSNALGFGGANCSIVMKLAGDSGMC